MAGDRVKKLKSSEGLVDACAACGASL